jgi:hypothetical protein
VAAAVDSGANGFLFSVNETTLAVLHSLRGTPQMPARLYAIVPYSYAYVRSAVMLGGFSGLAKEIGREMVLSRNWRPLVQAAASAIFGRPAGLLEAYLTYEVARLRTAAGRGPAIAAVILHEVVTDMALALDMRWLFDAVIHSASRLGVRPGFNTRNLPYLTRKLNGWHIDPRELVLAAPFNPIGFQMCPSRAACEAALQRLTGSTVIAFSILAAGHLTVEEAISYIVRVPNVTGVAIGVSTPDQARRTFTLFRDAVLRFPDSAPRAAAT